MARTVQEPTINEHGAEVHPAWGLISVNRGSGGNFALFDSDIRHNQTVTVKISTASRTRDLNSDFLFPEQQFVEVQMSEAQWASFVSSFGHGTGVPCTIRRRENDWQIPDTPYEPRLQESMDEVRGAAEKSMEKIREAFAAYEEKKVVANLRTLKYAIENAPSNMTFAAKSLSEHAENVVQKAKADIEAMVITKAQHLGLDPGDLGGSAGELMDGSES